MTKKLDTKTSLVKNEKGKKGGKWERRKKKRE